MTYADKWNASSCQFDKQNDYKWMTEFIREYHVVLEIGCGTGYSTLALAKDGHHVISIEKDKECLSHAKELIKNNGLEDRVTFIENDFFDCDFSAISIDVVCVWNIGQGSISKESVARYCEKMEEYGLKKNQIIENFESSYAETLIWNASRLAKQKSVPFHIIDRLVEISNTDYYDELKKEIRFAGVNYSFRKSKSLSSDGVILITQRGIESRKLVDIVFLSVLMK